MYSPVRYVFLNKSLGMTVGKASAQAVHAATMALIELDDNVHQAKWVASPHRTVIVLEARDEAHMRNIKEYLSERDVPTVTIIDEGVNEIDPHTWTALATRIMNKDAEDTIKALSTFNLYRDNIKVTLELNR